MKNLIQLAFYAIAMSLLVVSCSDDNKADTAEFRLDIEGLEDLGADYYYEGWIIVDGAPVTTGLFKVDAEGNLSESTFAVAEEDLEAATAFVLTIEPSPDPDPAPSAVHILAGDISEGSASLTVSHPAAIATDFTEATGSYILATPTDGGSDTYENSGVWFLELNNGPQQALDIPALPEGWAYEGWAVIDGQPVSTGTFTNASGADASSIYSGTAGGPPYPGEDFLSNAPAGLSFPTDLAGATVVISVEPVPDNSPAPFALKPLVSQVPDNAVDHTSYGLDNNAGATNPTGTVNVIR